MICLRLAPMARRMPIRFSPKRADSLPRFGVTVASMRVNCDDSDASDRDRFDASDPNSPSESCVIGCRAS